MGADEIEQRWPQAYGAMVDLFRNWRESGLADEAQLGFPLMPQGSEFISINSWPFARSVRCLLNDLFALARPHFAPGCLDGCAQLGPAPSSLSPCWRTCMWAALVERTPADAIAAVVNAALRHDSPAADAPPTTVSAGMTCETATDECDVDDEFRDFLEGP
eukprot:4939891-Prymnesium_polylepis.1